MATNNATAQVGPDTNPLTIKFRNTSAPSTFTRKKVLEGLVFARKVMQKAVNVVTEQKNKATRGAMFQAILKQIFRYNDAQKATGNLDALLRVMTLTRQGLSTAVTISDVGGRAMPDGMGGTVTGVEGYVTTKGTGAKGSIHLEFALVTRYTNLGIARLLIHEATHKFADTQDHAYAHQPGYATLTRAEALDNADSCSYGAISFYKNEVVNYNALALTRSHGQLEN